MKIVNVTPGLLPIPPNGWGAVEKIIWDIHNNLLKLKYDSKILYLNDIKDYDIVHIHVANLANLAHDMNIPYYFTMHDHHAYLYGKDSFVYQENLKAIKNAKKSFVPSKYLIDWFEGIPEYFSHGVNTDFFKPKDNFGNHKLLCVANNGFIHNSSEDRKGFGYAIKVAKKFNLPLTIVGPDNNKNYFEKNVPDYNKLNIIYNVDEIQLKEIYQDHTIFLSPSILEAGHPNLTILEALACGLPVLSTFEENNNLDGMIKIERDVDNITYNLNEVLLNYESLRNDAINQSKKLSWHNRTLELIKKYEYMENMGDKLINIYNKTEKLFIKPKELKPIFNINFINGAFVEILGGDENIEYLVSFIDKKTNQIIHSGKIKSYSWIKTNRKYFTDWRIEIVYNGIVYTNDLDLTDKKVLINFDSSSLGDTLAWFPYVEEFGKKHNCELIVSTFHNNLFKDQYENITFVQPGSTVQNIYAQYNIGLFYKDFEFDSSKHPSNPIKLPLMRYASDILGLGFKEIKPKLPSFGEKKYKRVCIAIHSTAQAKYWNNPTGWQEVVDYLIKQGYEVRLLSKEENGYMGNFEPKGVVRQPIDQISIIDTIKTLQESELFIGISSGLSWLAWASGIPVVLISGFTDDYLEPKQNVIRIINKNVCNSCWHNHKFDPGDWNWCPIHKNTNRQFECSKSITGKMVIEKLNELI
jgi:autotransporter strand-loop-strand O-heptosyltransferase